MQFDSLLNIKRFFQLIIACNGQEISQEETYEYISFPSSVWPNLIFNLKVRPENFDDWLNNLQAKIKNEGHPKPLMCNDIDMAPELLAQLKASPITNRYWSSMTYDLSKPINIKEIDRFKIKQITSQADINDWCYIAEQSLMRQSKLDEIIFHNLAKSELIEYYTGFEDGKPVAISMLFKDEEWAGIYFVGTLPEYERRGYGKALTQFAMQKGLERGCKQAVLQATQEGEPVYNKIGYENRGRIELFNLQIV